LKEGCEKIGGLIHHECHTETMCVFSDRDLKGEKKQDSIIPEVENPCEHSESTSQRLVKSIQRTGKPKSEHTTVGQKNGERDIVFLVETHVPTASPRGVPLANINLSSLEGKEKKLTLAGGSLILLREP